MGSRRGHRALEAQRQQRPLPTRRRRSPGRRSRTARPRTCARPSLQQRPTRRIAARGASWQPPHSDERESGSAETNATEQTRRRRRRRAPTLRRACRKERRPPQGYHFPAAKLHSRSQRPPRRRPRCPRLTAAAKPRCTQRGHEEALGATRRRPPAARRQARRQRAPPTRETPNAERAALTHTEPAAREPERRLTIAGARSQRQQRREPPVPPSALERMPPRAQRRRPRAHARPARATRAVRAEGLRKRGPEPPTRERRGAASG